MMDRMGQNRALLNRYRKDPAFQSGAFEDQRPYGFRLTVTCPPLTRKPVP